MINKSAIKHLTTFEKHYPPKEQLEGLNRLLSFLSSARIYWHKIWISGSTIKIKTEPPKGEIDTRIFYIYEDGGIDDNEFQY